MGDKKKNLKDKIIEKASKNQDIFEVENGGGKNIYTELSFKTIDRDTGEVLKEFEHKNIRQLVLIVGIPHDDSPEHQNDEDSLASATITAASPRFVEFASAQLREVRIDALCKHFGVDQAKLRDFMEEIKQEYMRQHGIKEKELN